MNLSLRSPSAGTIVAFKAIVFALCLLPAVNLALGWQANALGANPIETITRASGEWTLRLLLITLAVTPLRRFSGLHWLLRLRRMLGLFAFAYALGHFAIYLWLDQFFDWNAIALDILDRPFITVGFAAFVLLIPLAATSNSFAIRRLGGRRWQSLHRSVYAIAIFAVVPWLKDIQDSTAAWAKVNNPFFEGSQAWWLGAIPFMILAVILYFVGREKLMKGESTE